MARNVCTFVLRKWRAADRTSSRMLGTAIGCQNLALPNLQKLCKPYVGSCKAKSRLELAANHTIHLPGTTRALSA